MTLNKYRFEVDKEDYGDGHIRIHAYLGDRYLGFMVKNKELPFDQIVDGLMRDLEFMLSN